MPIFDTERLQPEAMPIERFPTSLGERLGAEAGETLESLPIPEIFRSSELASAKLGYEGGLFGYSIGTPTPDVPIDEARAKISAAGLDQHLKLPDQPSIKAPALDIMMERANRRREREATISRGPQGFIPGALSFGTGFFLPLLDPVNDAAFMIPAVGEARGAAWLASAGDSLMSRAAVRFGIGAAQGAAGTAALQPLEAWSRTQEGQDFTAAEAVRNMMMGAGLAGTMHGAGGLVGDAWRRATGQPLKGLMPIPTKIEALPRPSGEVREAIAPPLDHAAHAAWRDANAPPEALPPGLESLTASTEIEASTSAQPSLPATIVQSLPPAAHREAMQGALASLIEGEPVQAAEHLAAAGRQDPRVADGLARIGESIEGPALGKLAETTTREGHTLEDYQFTVDGRSGTAQVRFDPADPKVAYLDWIEGGENTFGPGAIRQVLNQFRNAHPEVETLRAKRVSGAREDRTQTKQYQDFPLNPGLARDAESAKASLAGDWQALASRRGQADADVAAAAAEAAKEPDSVKADAAVLEAPAVEKSSGRVGGSPASTTGPHAEGGPRPASLTVDQEGYGRVIDPSSEGSIEFVVEGGRVVVRGSQLKETLRGQGLGVAMYRRLADWALSQGKILESNPGVSLSAGRVYEALGRRGYTVEKELAPGSAELGPPTPVERFRPIFDEQAAVPGGTDFVAISDLVKKSGLPLDEVHKLLLEEAKANNVVLASGGTRFGGAAAVPKELTDAALTVPGHEPFLYASPKRQTPHYVYRVTAPPKEANAGVSTGRPLVDAVLSHPDVADAIANPKVNRRQDVPYTAGPDNEGPGLNLDKHLPEQLTTKSGKTFDPAGPYAVHEFSERHAIKELIKGGMSQDAAYRVAHWEIAEPAEAAWYKAHDIDPAEAEAAAQPFIDRIEHEKLAKGDGDVPAGLFKKPYPHDNVSAAAKETAPVPKPTAKEIAQAHKIFGTAEKDMTPRRRKVDEEKLSLIPFLAARGGIKETPDLRAIFDKNPFVPGFGRLFRKTGMDLDRAREAAAEANYIANEGSGGAEVRGGGISTTNDLLAALHEENRGNKRYRPGHEPEKGIDREQEAAHIESAMDHAFEQEGVPVPAGTVRARTLELMTSREITDPHLAYERAVMEEHYAGREGEEHAALPADIAGFDFPHDAGPAPPDRGAAAGEREAGRGGTGGAPRQRGEDNRTPTERGAEGLPQHLIPGVEPVTEKQRLDLQAAKPMRGGNAAPPAGGLFDETARNQADLFQQPARPRSPATKAALAAEQRAAADFASRGGDDSWRLMSGETLGDALAAIDRDTAEISTIIERGAACLTAAVGA